MNSLLINNIVKAGIAGTGSLFVVKSVEMCLFQGDSSKNDLKMVKDNLDPSKPFDESQFENFKEKYDFAETKK